MFSSNATQVSDAAYIEDVFSTFLYTGTRSTQTITNGIDLAGRGGLVWFKCRPQADAGHAFYTGPLDGNFLLSPSGNQVYWPSTDGNRSNSGSSGVTFNSTGFSVGVDSAHAVVNYYFQPYVSWTFRKQPRFFDIVTYTGNGLSQRSIPHSLGVAPGAVITKSTSASEAWYITHRRGGAVADRGSGSNLNTTASRLISFTSAIADASTFLVGNQSGWTSNTNGVTYVAYIFAHDAGGFGATGTDNVISCGSYTGNGSATGPVVTLGWEPQWLLVKNTSGAGSWQVIDNMRGMPVGVADAALQANQIGAETSVDYVSPTATGFQVVSTSSEVNTNGSTYIYIAIRRGPMRTPTTGTSVFNPVAYTGTAAPRTLTYGFPVDNWFVTSRTGTNLAGYENSVFTRLLSADNAFETTNAAAWGGGWGSNYLSIDNSTGVSLTSSNFLNSTTTNYISYGFRRAPGFFDVVAYSGTGANQSVSHNLGVAPELLIAKSRNDPTAWTFAWGVYVSSMTTPSNQILALNVSNPINSGSSVLTGAPSSTSFTLNTSPQYNGSVYNYIAYLFASCPGVSRVGTYTGTGTTQVIDCGFSSGARFVLIKRTDATGDWYVWDTARGIVAANDPYFLLNSTAAEVTNTDWVDPAASGFGLSNAAGNLVNTNGGSYIFLAIA